MLDKKKIVIARACSYQTEHHQVGTWMFTTGMQLCRDQRFESAWTHVDTRFRIHNSRNTLARWSLERGMDYLLFIDGDMHADFRLMNPELDISLQPDARPWAKPFLQSSLDYMMGNPCGVIGAPAVSGPPDNKINTFIYDANVDGNVRRMRREDMETLEPQMLPVVAIGTGLMLIDINVFRKLPPPWFEDVEDDRKEEVSHSQDCNFCLKCNANHIPVFANLFAPARHLKIQGQDPPEYKGEVCQTKTSIPAGLSESSPSPAALPCQEPSVSPVTLLLPS